LTCDGVGMGTVVARIGGGDGISGDGGGMGIITTGTVRDGGKSCPRATL